jgi:hypothetical protein
MKTKALTTLTMKTNQIQSKSFEGIQISDNYFAKCLVMLLVCIFVEAAALAQPPQPLPTPTPPKGLLTRLIEIKYTAELYLSNALKQVSNNNDGKDGEGKVSGNAKDSALATYNTLRWKVDGFVYQLSSEMIASNSPRQWRILNDWCLYGNRKSEQMESLQVIENFYTINIKPVMITSTKTLNLTTNVFYLLKDSYTIVKGLSDMKTQKTMALIELLDHTRLLPPGELAKLGK